MWRLIQRKIVGFLLGVDLASQGFNARIVNSELPFLRFIHEFHGNLQMAFSCELVTVKQR